MAFPRQLIGKSKTWKTILIVAIVMVDLHLTDANICVRIANCSCQDPTRLMCSGNSSLNIYQLKKIVPAAYVIYIDIRGRRVSERFLLDLILYFPRLRVLRIDKTLCTLVAPLIGKLHFTVIHNCFVESTSTDISRLTTTFPQDLTTQLTPTQPQTSPPVVIYSTTLTQPSHETTPVHISSSSSLQPSTVTHVAPVVPSHDPGDIVISAGHSAGFYVSIVIPTTTLASIIIGILSCCFRWFTNRFVPCLGYRQDRAGDCGGDPEAGHSVELQVMSVDQPQTGGSDSGVKDKSGSTVPSSRVVATKNSQGELTISEMNVVVKKESDQTAVKVPIEVPNAISIVESNTIPELIKSDPSSNELVEESASRSAETTLVGTVETSTDRGAEGQLAVPSQFIELSTSTPIKNDKKRSFSFMSCFGGNTEGYRALSPASVGTPASAYQTPAVNLSPSAESMVSTVQLIKEEKDYPTRSKRGQFDLLPGVEPRTRAPRKYNARLALQKKVELSASSEDLNKTAVKRP